MDQLYIKNTVCEIIIKYDVFLKDLLELIPFTKLTSCSRCLNVTKQQVRITLKSRRK